NRDVLDDVGFANSHRLPAHRQQSGGGVGGVLEKYFEDRLSENLPAFADVGQFATEHVFIGLVLHQRQLQLPVLIAKEFMIGIVGDRGLAGLGRFRGALVLWRKGNRRGKRIDFARTVFARLYLVKSGDGII